jgi:branched-chain amino acid transport system permease protein
MLFFTAGLIRFIIGPGDQKFNDGTRFILKARDFKEMTGLNEGLAIKTTQGITVVVTILLVAILFWFLNKTRTGKSMRAYSDNEDLALLSGISPKKVVMTTWVITGILATVAGALYGLDKSYKPFTYMYLVLPVFASAILGGVGNPLGAIVGGYVIAFSELIFTFAYKKVFTYMLPEHLAPKGLVQLLSTDYKIAVSFVILVIVLLIKPTGIFSGKTI